LKRGRDRTGEVASEELKKGDLFFTTDPADLNQADFHIVAVPTPVDSAKRPDLGFMLRASEVVGGQLKRGDLVVYESTVYPGATEEECLPVLERVSGLRAGKDFFVGYSPERINPGDPEHRLDRVVKVVSAQDPKTLDTVAQVYQEIVSAGVHRAPSIRVAEAAKVIENIQRDVNIALVNELAMIFHKMGIDTQEVLAAARTKWNFLPFSPGLVGGHCIGVDPYYLTHKAAELGYTPEMILSGRRINDSMGIYVAGQVIKGLIRLDRSVKGAIVTVLGLTFKENVPDLRNSKVFDIIRELADYGVVVQAHDPLADPEVARKEYGIRPLGRAELRPADGVVLAVPHRGLMKEGWKGIVGLLKGGDGLMIDVKGALPAASRPEGVVWWRL
jgi:UDP-N-acetyl-D-galactosamine dehydrogenase